MMVQIGFSTSRMFLSRLIRWVTGAKYSHCWFVFEMYGKKWILQSDVGGVQIDPYEKFVSRWVNVKLIEPKYPVDLSVAWDFLSENYDYAGLFGEIWVYLGRWFHKKWKNPLASAHAQWCSEFVVRTLQSQGTKYPGIELLDPAEDSPEDLLAVLEPGT